MLGAGDLLKGFRVARNLNRLAVRFVETHKTPGTYPDGGNLYLTVTATGSRRWVFKYKTRRPAGTGSKHRLSREMGLGSWPDIGLAKARDLAGAARKLLADGIDPIDNRRTERSRATGVTFGEVATDLHADKQHGWRNAKHRAAWLQTLQVHGASIWNRPIDSITTADVLTCLRPIWTSHAETASRVRGRMEQVFDAGRVHGAIPQDRPNPGTWKGNLSHMLPTRAKLQRGHHKSMPWKDVRYGPFPVSE